ncbi:helicase-related protein [Paucibacter sp. JuS9]|uniref:helicase-related protein n=1 Tax=Paucibacter sp. JuS9 TaxID=3228748 RepID=UPI003757B89C
MATTTKSRRKADAALSEALTTPVTSSDAATPAAEPDRQAAEHPARKPAAKRTARKPKAAATKPSIPFAELLAEPQADLPAELPAQTLPASHSEIWLNDGLSRELCWRAGTAAPLALCEAAAALFGEDGALDAEQAQTLDGLLALSAELGHELRVAPAVWEQLSFAADARERVRRLETTLAEGADLHALAALRQPLPEFQWEAALFALCAGRSLIADDLGLGHRATALAALQLWRRLFGLGSVVLLAPLERHAAWVGDAEAWLGGWPTGLQLLEPGEAPLADAELLIVDGVQLLEGLPLVATPHLLLLADRELLGEPLLGELVDWIDSNRRGPLRVWCDEAAAAGKRQQRELLQTVMLSRRKRDLLPRLPVVLEQAWWSGDAVELDAQAMAQLQHLQERWQSQRYLSAGEQLRLMSALQTLRQVAQSPSALSIKGRQVLDLLPQLIPAAAQRVAMFAQADATVQALAARLREQGLAVAELLLAQTPEQRQTQVDAWRGDARLVLAACDAACTGIDLQHELAALIHADQPWNPAQRVLRARRLNGDTGRGLPAWNLLIKGSFDALQRAAQAGKEQLPAATLDFELGARPFLAAADLVTLMDALAGQNSQSRACW